MFDATLLDETARDTLRRAAAALDLSERNGDPCGLSQALAQMARSLTALQAYGSAESYLEAALRWSRAAGSIDATVDLLCQLSDTTERLAHAHDVQRRNSGHAARERARDHAFEAALLAGRVADAQWEIKVLLRISEVLDRCGDRDDAVQMQARAMRLMSRTGADMPNPNVMPGLGRLADL